MKGSWWTVWLKTALCLSSTGVSKTVTKRVTHGTTVNPMNGLTMQELQEKTRLKTAMFHSKGHTVIDKWECEFRKDIEADEELKAFFKEYEPYFHINPRDAFFGGQTNAIALQRQEADICYVDLTSLYPWVCKYGLFPLGHPSVFYKDAIPERVQGLLKCKILPPSHLYHLLLPARIYGKLMFVLCRTCGEEGAQGNCAHTDEERALMGTWVSMEIDKGLALGYKMVAKYAAWHFEETTQYKDGAGGLWVEYIDLWLKLKQEASGYPSWCTTEKLKKQYMANYQRHEGIRLSPARIMKNEGLRSLCKIMLNSHWG